MTTFDKREEAFEKQFVLDEEHRFKAIARRNKLLGLWVAERLGLAGEPARDYARAVVASEFDGAGDAGVLHKVMTDLSAKGVMASEDELAARMNEFMADAVIQVKTEM